MKTGEPILHFNPGESWAVTAQKHSAYKDYTRCFWCRALMLFDRAPSQEELRNTYLEHETLHHARELVNLYRELSKAPVPTTPKLVDVHDDLASVQVRVAALRKQMNELNAECVALEQRRGRAVADIITEVLQRDKAHTIEKGRAPTIEKGVRCVAEAEKPQKVRSAKGVKDGYYWCCTYTAAYPYHSVIGVAVLPRDEKTQTVDQAYEQALLHGYELHAEALAVNVRKEDCIFVRITRS